MCGLWRMPSGSAEAEPEAPVCDFSCIARLHRIKIIASQLEYAPYTTYIHFVLNRKSDDPERDPGTLPSCRASESQTSVR